MVVVVLGSILSLSHSSSLSSCAFSEVPLDLNREGGVKDLLLSGDGFGAGLFDLLLLRPISRLPGDGDLDLNKINQYQSMLQNLHAILKKNKTNLFLASHLLENGDFDRDRLLS